MAPSDDWQPRPGEPHPIDKAFYDLTVKERDYERTKVDRLERQLAGAVSLLCEAKMNMDWSLDVPMGKRLRWATDVDALEGGGYVMGLRYVADQTADGMPMVLDTASTLAGIVCRCRTDADAEMVARALNTQGAVSEVDELRAELARERAAADEAVADLRALIAEQGRPHEAS